MKVEEVAAELEEKFWRFQLMRRPHCLYHWHFKLTTVLRCTINKEKPKLNVATHEQIGVRVSCQKKEKGFLASV